MFVLWRQKFRSTLYFTKEGESKSIDMYKIEGVAKCANIVIREDEAILDERAMLRVICRIKRRSNRVGLS